MKKIYCIFIISILFNCANAQDNANEDSPLQFDDSRAISNLSEEELIFTLEENAPGNNTQLLNQDRLLVAPKENPASTDELITAPAPAESKPREIKQKTTQPQKTTSAPQTVVEVVDEKKLTYVKTLYNRSQFFLLSKTVMNENEHEALYYQALGNYNLVRKEPRYQGRLNATILKERNSLIATAKENLFNVGIKTTDAKLKEKAIFWYGVMSFTHAKNPKDETELTDTFLYIEENMRGSNIYNDALVYLMMIYKKLGKITKAKEYYKKVLRTGPNDLIYNYRTDRLVPAKDIVRLYQDLR